MGRKQKEQLKMRFFKLLVGRHNEAGIDYDAGDIIETSNDLVAMFDEKFEEAKALDTPDDVSGEYDQDCTEEYTVTEGIRVCRKGSWYYVLQDSVVKNESGLRKDDIQEFIDGLDSND